MPGIKTFNDWIRLYLGAVFLATLYIGHQVFREVDPWRIGDWLINYRGGFTRRGLSGEMVWWAHRALGLDPILLISMVQGLCYGLFLFCAYRLIAGAPRAPDYVLLIFSPFIFLFQVHVPQGGFRKEILLLALLAWLVLRRRDGGELGACTRWAVAGVVFPALVLSHEMLALYWPLVLLVLLWGASPRRWEAAALSLPSALALLALVAWSHPTPATASAICDSWQGRAPAQCAQIGPLVWLTSDWHAGLEASREVIRNNAALVVYPLVLLLALPCYWPIRARLRALLADRWSRWLLLAALAGALGLCIVAIDWGRFLYIDLVALFLLSFLPVVPAGPRPARAGWVRALTAGLLAFNLLWHIPHSGVNFFLGYDISRKILHWL